MEEFPNSLVSSPSPSLIAIYFNLDSLCKYDVYKFLYFCLIPSCKCKKKGKNEWLYSQITYIIILFVEALVQLQDEEGD